MKTLKVVPYTSTHKSAWDAFCKTAKNSTFLHRRDFMDYHNDRFQDHSLMVYKEQKLIAVLPANIKDNVLYSHGGLTYGGIVLQNAIKLTYVLHVLQAILKHLAEQNITTLELKLLPRCYQIESSEDIEYALFLAEAKLIKREPSATVDYNTPFKIQSNRIEGVKKAKKHQLEIKETTNVKEFWNEILIPTLEQRHETKPVHSVEEIEQLMTSFPENIKQFSVYKDEKIIAGALIFETKTVAHTQYIGSNEDRQSFGGLDFLFHHLIKEHYKHKQFFSFGISTTNNGKSLNTGLNSFKEGFGARTFVHDTYCIDTSNYQLIKSTLQ